MTRSASDDRRGNSREQRRTESETTREIAAAVLSVVLVSSLSVGVLLGAPAGVETNGGWRLTVDGGTDDRAGVTASATDADAVGADTTVDGACVPETGDDLVWHLERYGSGCPNDGVDSSPTWLNRQPRQTAVGGTVGF